MTQHGRRDQNHDRRTVTPPSREHPVASTYSVREAATLLGVSRKLLYKLIAQGRSPVPCLKLGRVIRIPKAGLEGILGEHEGQR